MPHTSKKTLTSMLLDMRGAGDGSVFRFPADTPAIGTLSIRDMLAAERPTSHSNSQSMLGTTPHLTRAMHILGRALSTQRGSHSAVDGVRRLTHRYTNDELWILCGAGTVGLRAVPPGDVMDEARKICAQARKLVATNASMVRAMSTLRLLLLWRSCTDDVSIFTRDGLHIVASLHSASPPASIHTDGSFLDFPRSHQIRIPGDGGLA